MDEHFTVEVSVKQTIPPKPIEDSRGYSAKGPMGSTQLSERRVLDRAKVVVSAETEALAVMKAIRILRNAVDFPGAVEPEEHLHRASCHGPIGELQCGFPPGPTIASRAS